MKAVAKQEQIRGISELAEKLAGAGAISTPYKPIAWLLVIQVLTYFANRLPNHLFETIDAL